jgi:hypothetical protein
MLALKKVRSASLPTGSFRPVSGLAIQNLTSQSCSDWVRRTLTVRLRVGLYVTENLSS